jgi:hypothetical protein
VKDAFDDFLFGLLDGALFGAFVDDGFDLIFGNGAVLIRGDREEPEKEVAGFV